MNMPSTEYNVGTLKVDFYREEPVYLNTSLIQEKSMTNPSSVAVCMLGG